MLDSESEVRACALRHLAEFSSMVSMTLILHDLLPALKELQEDEMTYVRIALASNMLSQITAFVLVPYLLEALFALCLVFVVKCYFLCYMF